VKTNITKEVILWTVGLVGLWMFLICGF